MTHEQVIAAASFSEEHRYFLDLLRVSTLTEAGMTFYEQSVLKEVLKYLRSPFNIEVTARNEASEDLSEKEIRQGLRRLRPFLGQLLNSVV